MENRRKDTRDVYFFMLGYDIGTYEKHSVDSSGKKTHEKCIGNKESVENTS